jgi:hypothetical protein
MSLLVAKSPHAVSAGDEDMVRDWLFLVLRYAVSREARDRRAVLDLAAKMDTLGKEREREVFRFFRSQRATMHRHCGTGHAGSPPDSHGACTQDRAASTSAGVPPDLPPRIAGEDVSEIWQNRQPP